MIYLLRLIVLTMNLTSCGNGSNPSSSEIIKKHHENNRPGLGKKEVSRFLAQEASPKSTQKMQNEKKVYENSRPGLTKKQETQKVPKTAKIPKKPKNGVGARPLHSPKF